MGHSGRGGRARGALGAYLRRLRARLGAPKAITAAAHKLARILYHLMRLGEAHVKRTEEAYAFEVPERLEKQLARPARELCFGLKKVEAAEAAGEGEPPGQHGGGVETVAPEAALGGQHVGRTKTLSPPPGVRAARRAKASHVNRVREFLGRSPPA